MGADNENEKALYYNILEKELKNSYVNVQNNKFNKEYIFKNLFILSNKYEENNIREDDINWKTFLLDKLDSHEVGSWEFSLYNYIDLEYNKNRLEENYIYENEIFYNQFFLRNNPQLALKDSENLHEPVLYLLNNREELDTFSENDKKSKKSNSNKKKEKKKLKI